MLANPIYLTFLNSKILFQKKFTKIFDDYDWGKKSPRRACGSHSVPPFKPSHRSSGDPVHLRHLPLQDSHQSYRATCLAGSPPPSRPPPGRPWRSTRSRSPTPSSKWTVSRAPSPVPATDLLVCVALCSCAARPLFLSF